MENRVNTMHGVGKTESIGMSAGFGYDGIGSKEFLCEFLGWSSCVNVFRSKEDLIPNLIIQRIQVGLVCCCCKVLLSMLDLFFEFSMKIMEVDGIVKGSDGGYIAFRKDRNLGMVSLVGIEWGNSSGFAGSIVVSKLC